MSDFIPFPPAAITMKFGLKFPTFRAAPGSIDAIQEEAKHMCRNDQPTHYDASKGEWVVVVGVEMGLELDHGGLAWGPLLTRACLLPCPAVTVCRHPSGAQRLRPQQRPATPQVG